MPAPNNPNTGPMNAKNIRRGDNTAADRLISHGWIVIPPEAELDGATLARITAALVAAKFTTS